MRIITLITDYGARDHYVGVLKGVISSIAPDARTVDITHEIEPHNVAHGAFVLWQTLPWFPPETVHLAIVDPGVGTQRRILVGKYAGQFVVVPDNGLLTYVQHAFPAEALHLVEDPRFWLPQISATFHGRDIMAPVAAHLALGVHPAGLGRAIQEIELLPTRFRADAVGDRLVGQIIHVDRFGNLITNIHRDQLTTATGEPRHCRVQIGDADVGDLRTTFADAAIGEPVAYIGSAGLLEIAINQGRAADRFSHPRTLPVTVVPLPGPG